MKRVFLIGLGGVVILIVIGLWSVIRDHELPDLHVALGVRGETLLLTNDNTTAWPSVTVTITDGWDLPAATFHDTVRPGEQIELPLTRFVKRNGQTVNPQYDPATAFEVAVPGYRASHHQR